MILSRLRYWWHNNRPVVMRASTVRFLRGANARAEAAAIHADALVVELAKLRQTCITPRKAQQLKRQLRKGKA